MIRLIAFLLAAIALLAAAPQPAAASFGDCEDPAYIATFGFDREAGSGPFLCVERARVDISTPHGERSLRIIHHAAYDWAPQPGAYEATERGLRAAAEALNDLGSYEIEDVTVLLLDDFPPGALESPGSASEIAGETRADDDECRIVFYLLGVGGDPANLEVSVAHEIFHCVQLATLSNRQMTSGSAGTGQGGDWWLEGSPEWFAHYTLDTMGLLPSRVASFDRQVEEGRSLIEMAYGATPFFIWLANERGPSSVVPFLRQMADSRAPSAQYAAMRSALPPEDWQRFAQDYIDGNIQRPRGAGPLPFSVSEGETWTWSASRAEDIELAPFTITHGRVHFECGAWRIETRPSSVRYGTRPMSGSIWGPLPAEIDTEAGNEADHRFVSISPETRRQTLTIDVERMRSCEPCGGTQEIDRCLTGVWEQSGGGAVEWMRSQMPPNVNIPVAEQAGGAIILNEDGTYWTAPLSQHIVIVAEEHDGTTTADGTGEATAVGRWSAEGGQLNMCQDSGGLAGSAQVTTPDTSFNMPFGSPGAGNISMRYTCSEGSFSTQMDIPGSAAPMSTQYSKIGG